MAIENSIAGSILPNYNLLQKSNLKVIGEVYLSISQNLMVNKGVKLSDVKEVLIFISIPFLPPRLKGSLISLFPL